MGVFERMRRIIGGNLNQMLNKAEDPEKVLSQVLVEMNTQLIESKRAVAGAIADEKKLERQMLELINQGKEWERKAILAVRAAEQEPQRGAHFEGLAKQALLQKKACDEDAERFKEQWTAQHSSVEQLKDALRALQQKIEEAQRKKNLLIARSRRAEAQKKIQSHLSGMQKSTAFEAFDRMESKVDQIEAEVDALKEIDGPAMSSSLEKEFAALEGSTHGSGDQMLEDLKSRLSLEAPGGQAKGPQAPSNYTKPVDVEEVDSMMEDLKRKLKETEGPL